MKSAAKRPVVVIRNGMKLCAHCRDAGCDRNIGAPDVETEHTEDTPANRRDTSSAATVRGHEASVSAAQPQYVEGSTALRV